MPSFAPRVDRHVEWLYESGNVPRGHAVGRVQEVRDGRVFVRVGESCLSFRRVDFPHVNPGDVVAFGPSITRWRMTGPDVSGERDVDGRYAPPVLP